MINFKELKKNLLKIKTADEFLEVAKNSELKKSLSIFDLIVLGIGAVVGTGIFTIVGIAAKGGPDSIGAGPALIVSMVIAALACVFAALCYSEFASMIPVAGSAYTYTYATMGEFMAWLVGWILMLEYAIGNITVASAWTEYLFKLLQGFPFLPNWVTNPPMWLIHDYRTALSICNQANLDIHQEIPHFFNIPICINLPAIIIVFLITILLIRGIKESTKLAGFMVGLNLCIICSFILVGMFYVKPENWVPFAPNGFSGIFAGAFIIFFAYIGFDAISTAAEETKNPQRDLPIGILGTLVLCTIIYILVALVLTGVMPLNDIDVGAPIAHAMSYIGKDKFAGFISIGALAGLTSVLLVYQLGTTRILYAMSRDNFLPKMLQKVNTKFNTPHVVTWISGLIVILGALFLDIEMSAELCNFGTFASFIIVCLGVMILRHTDPDRKRVFKVPFVPLIPILGILCCGFLMGYKTYLAFKLLPQSDSIKDILIKLLTSSPFLFIIWLILGVIFYFSYCYTKQRKEEEKSL